MSAPLIEVTGLCVGYADRPVLRSVDLAVHPGERLALLGDNGAGKSTLLHAMVGLIPVAGGTVRAFGAARRTEADFRAMRRKAGMVFQHADDQLFCPTVIEDVAFGPLNLGQSPAAARATAEATLERLDLAELADRVTHRLSGGEKRLVALATVLAMEPEVLLLDEPTAGLDAQAYERLCALLASLPQAMVIVAHESRFLARLASRAVLIRDGRSEAGQVLEHSHPLRHIHFRAGSPS